MRPRQVCGRCGATQVCYKDITFVCHSYRVLVSGYLADAGRDLPGHGGATPRAKKKNYEKTLRLSFRFDFFKLQRGSVFLVWDFCRSSPALSSCLLGLQDSKNQSSRSSSLMLLAATEITHVSVRRLLQVEILRSWFRMAAVRDIHRMTSEVSCLVMLQTPPAAASSRASCCTR